MISFSVKEFKISKMVGKLFKNYVCKKNSFPEIITANKGSIAAMPIVSKMEAIKSKNKIK
jgi:hypothetical protein